MPYTPGLAQSSHSCCTVDVALYFATGRPNFHRHTTPPLAATTCRECVLRMGIAARWVVLTRTRCAAGNVPTLQVSQ